MNGIDHTYTWDDLRERPFGELAVGRVVFKPDAFAAYRTGGPDGRVCGLSWVLNGSPWRITARVGDEVTLVRADGECSQTARIHPGMVVLAVVRYYVYVRDQKVLATDDAVEALREVMDTRGAYLVTDGLGARESAWPSPRHNTHGVLDKPTCKQTLTEIGPRTVGATTHSHYWRRLAQVTDIQVGVHSRISWRCLSITERNLDEPFEGQEPWTSTPTPPGSSTHPRSGACCAVSRPASA